MALRLHPASRPGLPSFDYRDEPDGRASIWIGFTALPCPGVALRFNTLIDCTPAEERMPPVTIDFVRNLPPAAGEASSPQGVAAAPAAQAPQPQVAGRFTCDSGDFLLLNQLRRVEEMVAAAGLPRECAPSVSEFCHLSASSATNTFFKAVAITVEVGTPGSILVEDEDEDEEAPAGAVIAECAICYKMYVVGGSTSVKMPCSHAFHRKCLDKWTSVRPTCPYCRAPVPEEHQYWEEEEDPTENDISGHDDYRSPLPDGETRSLDISRPLTSSTWSRIGSTAVLALFVLGLVSILARPLSVLPSLTHAVCTIKHAGRLVVDTFWRARAIE